MRKHNYHNVKISVKWWKYAICPQFWDAIAMSAYFSIFACVQFFGIQPRQLVSATRNKANVDKYLAGDQNQPAKTTLTLDSPIMA